MAGGGVIVAQLLPFSSTLHHQNFVFPRKWNSSSNLQSLYHTGLCHPLSSRRWLNVPYPLFTRSR